MPVIVPSACYSWESGQGNGKRILPPNEEGFWAKSLLSLIRVGFGMCKEKVFRGGSPNATVFEYMTLRIK